MAMTDLYNSDDVRKFDYTVYIKDISSLTSIQINTFISKFSGLTNYGISADNFDLATFSISSNGFYKLGKLDRAVSYTTEDGETIVDNEQYENVITKTGSVNAEHIAVDNAIVRQMRELDGKDLMVLYVSKKGTKYHNILFPRVRYDYEETETSGNVQRLPFSLSRQIDNVASFRKINEFDNSTYVAP